MRELAEPVAREASLDLVDVEVKGGGAQRLVRVTVDRKGGVTIEACQELSRRLSVALDEQDPVEGGYKLEVTSPGTDHPLQDREAFERVEGRAVLVQRDEGDGRVQQLRGTVTGADDSAVVLDVDGRSIRVPYAEIVKATQTLPW
nr:ribosome maturation factor RimP [Egibacter rhizosphaerae]